MAMITTFSKSRVARHIRVHIYKVKKALFRKPEPDKAMKPNGERLKELDARLLETAKEGSIKLAERLIKLGANIEARDSDGMTALMCAARYGHADFCRFLLEKDAKINLKDGRGMTAIMYAAANGYTAICTLLLSNGADAKLTNYDNMAAAGMAKMNHHSGTVALLSSPELGKGYG